MRYPLVIAVVLLSFIRPMICRADDHATIIGDLYDYQFCDSCDHSLYRYEGPYHIPLLTVGDGEAGILQFNMPPELKPFEKVQLQLYLNQNPEWPPPTFDVALHGFDGVTGNVGPSDIAQSIPITSPYSVILPEDYWSVDVTDFLRSALHSNVSFVLTGNTTVWTMYYPQLLVYPVAVPEPASIAPFFIAAIGALSLIRRR
jgi:hypothetical protein